VTVVVGASTGIGRAIALRQARAGEAVHALMRDPAAPSGLDLAELAEGEGLDLRLGRIDVCDDESVAAAFDEVAAARTVGKLVCSAGRFLGSTLEATEVAELQDLLDVNFLGPLRCVKRVITPMRERGGGRILAITSQSSAAIFPTWTAYSGSKGGLEAALESLAMELRPFGIQVGSLRPGVTLTAMRGKIRPRENPDAYDDLMRRYRSLIAADRETSMEPDDVATVAEQLLAADEMPLVTNVGEDAHRNLAMRKAAGDRSWVDLFDAADDEEFFASWRRLEAAVETAS
jgi:NAD(P)-dependent dehydrogenase (short-subunit alcohol dehydrogenase family)